MKTRFFLFAFIISADASGQNDTIMYFSSLNKPVQSASEATYYQKLTGNSPDNYNLSYFKKSGDKWERTSITRIKRESDTSFKMISTNEIIRIYNKVDTGYIINDVQKENNNLFFNRTGFSKRLFPPIRSGIWKSYNPLTGDIVFEDFYRENMWISNKYWINDTAFIRNVYSLVDEHAEFQGGESALMDFIRNNIDYPFEARRRGIQGTVSVGFVILNNGQIIGARVLNVADKSFSKEALRVVNLTQKKWTPGKIENKSVNSFILIPVTFKLQ